MLGKTTESTHQQLGEQFRSFNQELVIFVESCSDSAWRKVTVAEGWPIGVTAHHIGTIHYPVAEWVWLIANGRPVPEMTADELDRLNARLAQESTHYMQREVAEMLQSAGAKALSTIAELGDVQWERTDFLKLLGVEISAARLFRKVLIDSARDHLESMKTTAAR